MSDENPDTPAPEPNLTLTPIDHHILTMLATEQWTTGALIDIANTRAYNRDLILDDRDPDDFDQDDPDSPDPVTRNMINDGLRVFRKFGIVSYAHKNTSLYRLEYDPRNHDCPPEATKSDTT